MAAINLIAKNSRFESPGDTAVPLDWTPVWSRQPGAATGVVDTTTTHSGSHSFHVTSAGTLDWSFANNNELLLPKDAVVTISAWVKSTSATDAEIGVVERSADGQTINWMAGSASCGGTHDWVFVHRTFLPPENTQTIQFRLTGSGPGDVWIGDASLSMSAISSSSLNDVAPIRLASSTLNVTIDPLHDGAMTVSFVKSRHHWQQGDAPSIVVASVQKIDPLTARINLLNRDNVAFYTATIHLSNNAPTIVVNVSGSATNELSEGLQYPPAFDTAPGDALVIPTNEGLLYPVDDSAVAATNYQLYQGHGGLCMAWFGQETLSDGSGVMAIIPTPDDATLQMLRPDPSINPLLSNQISWEASKGAFAYNRTIRYLFFESGGYVAQAKAYRRYAESIGLVKTLAQKRAANPSVDKLIGAADVWDWDDADALTQAKQFKDSGMDRILWANAESADTIDKMNQLGFLTSRYDIYQDEYDPASPSWDPKGDDWPNDLIVDSNGNRVVSWIDYQTGPDGTKVAYTANACCSIPSLVRAERGIPLELASKRYNCRFIDTITASPWRECYSDEHPTTRTLDKQTKMRLLDFVSGAEHLVTGSETGIDCAVPFEDYFEGMMSLSHYRLPDSGYKIGVYQTPTPDFLKFQIGVGYRIPLFELVYHDCMVDTWYWGDASNQEPEVWRQRDLWNVLYGTNPIYILDESRWTSEKDRLLQSYKDVSMADRAVGYAQMLSHLFLTADHNVQQTRWSNGVVITVNFGATPYPASPMLGSLDYVITK
jgi:hypothetical protein